MSHRYGSLPSTRVLELFDGLRVVDLGHGVAAPLAARLLGDFGADVVKVEPPEGEEGRRLPPFANRSTSDDTRSLMFCVMNLNKRSVTADLRTTAGREMFMDFARIADVVFESFKPGTLDELGIGWDVLRDVNPRLVLTSITPFGQTGPYACYEGEEIVLYALSGIMSYSGRLDREPLKHGGVQAQYAGALNGAAATAVALLGRERTGQGEHIDISILQCIASTVIHAQGFYSFAGGVIGRRSSKTSSINGLAPCKDGYVVLQLPNEAAWRGLATLLGRPELLEFPFNDPIERRKHAREVDAIVFAALKDRTRAELFAQAGASRVLIGIVQDVADLNRCPHLDARHFFEQISQPGIGDLRVPTVPLQFSLTPYKLQRPAPRVGEHNLEFISESWS